MTDNNNRINYYNDILFFKIWRNIVIRNSIFQFLLVKFKTKTRFFRNSKQLCESFNKGELKGVDSILFTGKIIFIDGYEIPSTITSLNVGNKFNSGFKVGQITNSIKKLILGQNYNSAILKGSIPSSVTYIKMGSNFNQIINSDTLPNSLTEIDFFDCKRFIQLTAESIPHGVTSLKFTGYHPNFNTNLLPSTITKLTISALTLDKQCTIKDSKFIIPKNINDLTIVGNIYNCYTFDRNVIPNSVTSLEIQISETLSNKVEIVLSDLIPSTIKTLSIYNLGKSLSGVTPNGITKLLLGYFYNIQLTKDSLPDSITYLQIGNYYDLPLNLKHLTSLTYLEIRSKYPTPFSEIEFPNSLHTIKYNPTPNQSLSMYPQIKKLILGDNFNEELKADHFPPSLTHLEFSEFSFFNQPIGLDVLPKSLTYIDFGYDFNQTLLPFSIPPSVKKLILSRRYSKKFVANSLPPNLTYLDLGNTFSKKIGTHISSLSSLETLIVGSKFQQNRDTLKLPSSLASFVYK